MIADTLAMDAATFAAGTGWEITPEGACKADRCVRENMRWIRGAGPLAGGQPPLQRPQEALPWWEKQRPVYLLRAVLLRLSASSLRLCCSEAKPAVMHPIIAVASVLGVVA